MNKDLVRRQKAMVYAQKDLEENQTRDELLALLTEFHVELLRLNELEIELEEIKREFGV